MDIIDLIYISICFATAISQTCYPQGPCDAGYMDKTNGHHADWACGDVCSGDSKAQGGFTDLWCGCACIPEDTCSPTLSPTDVTVDPTNVPTVSPSDDPTINPTKVPSSTPSIPPSAAPSYSPTNAPSTSPTKSPTTCVDYYEIYNSTDGSDQRIAIIHPQLMNYSHYNLTVNMYLATLENNKNFYEEIIACNHTKGNVCFIGCYYSIACLEMQVKLTLESDLNADLNKLVIVCENRTSCKEMKVNILGSHLESVDILCRSIFV